jgi:rubrerythrin
MSKIFYINEILEFAVQKEEESKALYQTLAQIVDDPKMKVLFEQLMGEEEHHKEFYQEMLSEVGQKHTAGAPHSEEYNDYMLALIDSSRKISPLTHIQLHNLEQALDYAIGREKDSIVFYVGFKNYVPNPVKEKIDIIIKEEGKHFTRLSKLRQTL